MSKADVYGISTIASPEEAKLIAQNGVASFTEGGNFNKAAAVDFLNSILHNLESAQCSPLCKTMTMHILKELNYCSDSKSISVLASHKLLDFLIQEANKVDPKKRLEEKGIKKFPNQPDLGNQYMRVMLQNLVFWGEKYARGQNQQPSKFKRHVSDLKSKGIDLPKQNIFLDLTQVKSKKKTQTQTQTKEKSSSPVPIPIQGETPKDDKSHDNSTQLLAQLAFMKQKINIYMQNLDNEDGEDLRRQILNNHQKFSQQLTKYSEKMPYIQSLQDQTLISLFFKVHYFLEQENLFYETYIKKDDYPSYFTKLRVLYEQSAFQGKSELVQKLQHQQPKMQEQKSLSFKDESPRFKGRYEREEPATNKNISQSIFQRLEERSKSPQIGFKSVNKQLQKQKQNARKNPIRRTSRSPVGNRSVSLSRSATATRQKQCPLFSNPPNKYPAVKSYEGETIHQNRDLAKILYNIKKDQGIRRFKISNFREKNPLFESEHLQIGYKSHALYEPISGFSQFICLNIFLGNKTDRVIKQFKIQYKADTNQILYANPKNVDTVVPAGYQNKHDLMIAPLKIPFSFMTLHISYTIDNSKVLASVVVPNSILKLASYMTINKREFENHWQSCEKFKSLPFQLCKHYPPDSLKKWIPALSQGSDYKQFSQSGSETDLQYFCEVILLQKHEGVLKINIRPNLKVILQIGLLDNDAQSREYFKFYLETLEIILKQVQV